MTFLRTLALSAFLVSLLIVIVAFITTHPAAYGTRYSSADIPIIVADKVKLARMIQDLGVAETLKRIESDPTYQYNDGVCHGAAHAVGRAAYQLLGAQALEQCTTTCFSGCYHGAFQQIAESEDDIGLPDQVRVICSARTTVFERDECFHGAGHGFLIYNRYNLTNSLDECRALGTAIDAVSCYGGVFMENIVGDANPGGLSDADRMSATDPHFPCSLFNDDSRVQKACYKIQPTHFLSIYKDDFAKASEECLRARESMRGTCFRRLGQLSGADTLTPPQNTDAFCRTVPSEYFDDCILGGLRQVINARGIDPSGPPAMFCKGLIEKEAKEVCYAEYAGRLKDMFLDKETRIRICALFEAPFMDACRAVQE